MQTEVETETKTETEAGQTAWISYAAAGRKLAVSYATLVNLVEDKRLSELRVPGANPRLSRRDVEALLIASTRPSSVH